MLNRRILRIKAFKVLYAYAENPEMTLKEALSSLDASCEATRDLYLFMLSVIPPLTAEAARRIEAAQGKFNPTEEERHPNLKFARNALAPLLEGDPDFRKMVDRKKLSWEQYDVFLHNLYDAVREKPYFAAYMADPEVSLDQDVRLFKKVFEEEFEDNEALWQILEDLSLYWTDDLAYALTYDIRTLDDIRRTGRWELPPLYQSDILRRKGKEGVDSDRQFVVNLLSAAFARFDEYYAKVAGSVTKWDRDRLYTTDIVLIAMGLAEAEHFPEIPVKVTINEYVEIAKFYSTPKSRSFVNGLLDRLIRQSVGEGRINKSGRGLL
ncbi:MAG: transcription antitermination protein NusB [Bacteroidales bacterium]|nr:transcription antitermination protein NusB [Bacteroidales bacterium]